MTQYPCITECGEIKLRNINIYVIANICLLFGFDGILNIYVIFEYTRVNLINIFYCSI